MHNASAGSEPWTDRYSRQVRFAAIGNAGQERLRVSTALIVGCGALGASLAQHLTRAGIGTIRIADRDFVEPSNLQRQVLFGEADALAVLPKAVAAAEKLRGINSDIAIEAYVTDVNRYTIDALIDGADIVLDGTDNAKTRLLLSDACYGKGVPLVYGGVTGAEGMSAVLVPGATACLRCLIGGEDDAGDGESCDTVGVLSAAVEFIASLQAVETIKYLTGNKDAMRGSWLAADLWRFAVRELGIPAAGSDCRYCGPEERQAESGDSVTGDEQAGSLPVVLCGRDTVQVTMDAPLDLERLMESFRNRGFALTANRYLMKVSIAEGIQIVLFPDGRVLVQGTSDPDEAMLICRKHLHTAMATRR